MHYLHEAQHLHVPHDTTDNKRELANQHTEAHGVVTDLDLDAISRDKTGLDGHIQSSFPPRKITTTGNSPTSVPNSRHKSITQGGMTQFHSSSSSEFYLSFAYRDFSSKQHYFLLLFPSGYLNVSSVLSSQIFSGNFRHRTFQFLQLEDDHGSGKIGETENLR